MKKFIVVSEILIKNEVEADTEDEAVKKILEADIPEMFHSNFKGWEVAEINRSYSVGHGEVE